MPVPTPAAQPSPTPRRAPVTLAFNHRWDGVLPEEVFQSQVRHFQEANRHVTVSVTVTPERAVSPPAASAAAGATSDLSMLHTADAAALAAKNGLISLDPYLLKEGTNPDQLWFPAGASLTRLPATGKTFALPLNASGDAPFLFYNKHMLRQEGIDERALTTWDGLLTASRALTKPLGDLFIQVGFPYPAGHFPTWLLVNGVEILTPDGRAPAFNTPAARETLAYVVDSARTVYGAGRLNSFLSQTVSHRRGGMDSAFEQQRMAAWLTAAYEWQEVPKFAPGVDLGAARMPVNTANPRSRPTTLADGAWALAIPSTSQHPDDAWLLARWLGLDDGHRSLMIRLSRPSMVKRVSQDPIFSSLNPGWPLILETLQNATAIPPTRAWSRLLPILELLPSDLFGGRAPTPEGALATAEQQATSILASFQ